jgi:hypothetical protein
MVQTRRAVQILGVSLLSLAHAMCCCKVDPPPNSDVFSGCRCGARLVKVLIQVKGDDHGSCRFEVTPTSVCVARGGSVQFKVDNTCGVLKAGPAIEISQPRWKRLDAGARAPKDGILTGCSLRLAPSDKPHGIATCHVNSDAGEGFYKYDIRGEGIETLDPDIEIRGGEGTD